MGSNPTPSAGQGPSWGSLSFFHHLRHFAATTLAGAGIDVRTIAGRLGHANPAITLKTYAHFLEATDRQAADVMGKVALGAGDAVNP